MADINIPQHLQNVDFPATKQEILSAARDSDADGDVMGALNGLPDKTYNSMDDVGNTINS